MKHLVSHTTLKIEALRYVEDLFVDDNLISQNRSGWKLISGKSFEERISSDEMKQFVENVRDIVKKTDGDRFVDFDVAHVSALLFTKYRCTLDDSMLGFIVKSKTVLSIEEDVSRQKRGFFLFRFFGWLWRGFKRMHNGILDLLRIG